MKKIFIGLFQLVFLFGTLALLKFTGHWNGIFIQDKKLEIFATIILLISSFSFYLPMRKIFDSSFWRGYCHFSFVYFLLVGLMVYQYNSNFFKDSVKTLSQADFCSGPFSTQNLEKILPYSPLLTYIEKESHDACKIFVLKILNENDSHKYPLVQTYEAITRENNLHSTGHILFMAVGALKIFKNKQKATREIASLKKSEPKTYKKKKLKILSKSAFDLFKLTALINKNVDIDSTKEQDLLNTLPPELQNQLKKLKDQKKFDYKPYLKNYFLNENNISLNSEQVKAKKELIVLMTDNYIKNHFKKTGISKTEPILKKTKGAINKSELFSKKEKADLLLEIDRPTSI